MMYAILIYTKHIELVGIEFAASYFAIKGFCLRGGLLMSTPSRKSEAVENCLDEIKKILNSDLKYGTITVVVQDGLLIQIDTTEKKRINKN